MAQCIYCHQPVGFLKKRHPECEAKHQAGVSGSLDAARAAAIGSGPLDGLEERVRVIAADSFVDDAKRRGLLIQAWSNAVAGALEDGILSEAEEHALAAYSTLFGLSQAELNSQGAHTKVVKAAVLRDLSEGKLPQRCEVDGTLPLNFQKNEQIVWVFAAVKYFEQKSRTHYQGGYAGASVRVAKGVYFRTGGFRGYPVTTSETVHADTGILCVTNKHIYFKGGAKAFRIRLDKIVAFTPYNDGIGVLRDTASAKEQTFTTGDGWFTYNLLSNLSSM
jgi:hypothetical protein